MDFINNFVDAFINDMNNIFYSISDVIDHVDQLIRMTQTFIFAASVAFLLLIIMAISNFRRVQKIELQLKEIRDLMINEGDNYGNDDTSYIQRYSSSR